MVNSIGYIITYIALIATINIIAISGYDAIGVTQSVTAPPTLIVTDYADIGLPVVTSPDDTGLDAIVDLLIQFLNIIIFVIVIVLEFLAFAVEIILWLVTFQSLSIFGVPFIWQTFIAVLLNGGLVLAIILLIRGK